MGLVWGLNVLIPAITYVEHCIALNTPVREMLGISYYSPNKIIPTVSLLSYRITDVSF